jgi:hypothetical protein
LFKLENEYDSGSVERVTLDVDSQVQTIAPEDMKIHGLYVNEDSDSGDKRLMVAMETLDN